MPYLNLQTNSSLNVFSFLSGLRCTKMSRNYRGGAMKTHFERKDVFFIIKFSPGDQHSD